MVGKPSSPRIRVRRWVNSCRAGPGASLALELVVVVVAVVVVVVVSVLPLHQLWLLHPQHCQSDLWCSCETEQGKCSQERLCRDCQRPDVKIFDKKDKNQLYFDGCPHRAFKDRMYAWGYFIKALMLYNISSKLSTRFDFTYIEFKNLDLYKQQKVQTI